VEVRVVGDSFRPVLLRHLAVQGVGRRAPDAPRARRRLLGQFGVLPLPGTPGRRQLPAKLYEYLRAGRPTFGIVPRGGAADRWIRDHGSGVSVDSATPDAWTPALCAFLDSLSAYKAPPADAFHRRALTARLAALLDGVRA